MTITPTSIPDLLILEPNVSGDERGFFFESFKQSDFPSLSFTQDNQAGSGKGVLRGLHFQKPPFEQTKLIRVLSGEIFDVAVDLRPDSSTYKKWFGIVLSSEKKKQLLVPRGFAHGYLVISDFAEVLYKVDNEYSKASESGLRYDDPSLSIEWPTLDVPFQINERDRSWPLLGSY